VVERELRGVTGWVFALESQAARVKGEQKKGQSQIRQQNGIKISLT
jgi:hypothetical protein